MNEENKTSIIDVLSGRESIKVDIGMDWLTLTIIGVAVILYGTLLIYISKKM